MNNPQSSENICDLPLVTIVTPTYNRDKYLAATIRTVLAQTYPCIEYIVVDDGSTDQTRELCSRFKNVIYQYQDNAGQSSAINAGWSRAAGKYLMYLSSDDLLAPYAIANLVEAAEKCNDEIIIYPDYNVVDENGAQQSDVILGPFKEKLFFFELRCVLGPGVLFSKSLFDKYGGWNRRLRQVPDYEYWLRLSKDARIINYPRRLASSRVHSGAISYSKVSARRSLEVVRLVKRYILPRPEAHRNELLAKAYTVSMRYQLRAMQFRSALVFAKKIWKMDKHHLISIYFLRSAIGEMYHTVIRNALK